ncbi:MAG: hypothetical protein ACYDHN_11730 [Solirubrobacteraceae bacterium]
MPEHYKLIERIILGVVAVAISVDVLSAELPRVMPYFIVLAVIFIIIRLVLHHTRQW